MAIVTISREMGSGGAIIASDLAAKLGYTLVDGETILKEAEKHGLSHEAVKNADEKPPAFVDSLDARIEVDIHRIQKIILEYALHGDVVIYGRGGQDILEGVESVLTTRIIAPFELRVERWAEREWLDPDLSRILVRKSDQQRDGFIKYYFDRNWNDPTNYDLVINTAKISEEKAVELICNALKEKHLIEQRDNSKERLRELIMRKKIEIELIRSPDIDGYHMQIDVKQGCITLDGHIHSTTERDVIHEIINDQQPEYKIKDQLKVFAYHVNPKEV